VLVTAHSLSRLNDQISLHAFRTEEECKRCPIPVVLPDGTASAAFSDGWLDLDVATTEGSFSLPSLLELDRGTEPVAKWRAKVRRLLALTHGAYEKAFGTPYLTILVLTTAGELRLKNLLAWTEAELTELGEEAEAGLFRLGAVSTSELANPNLFITHPLFIPGTGEPTTLLADVPGHSFEAEATREEEGGDLPVYP
jgi:hypothetical protein